jgi:2-keto-4-pentenoate hydratase/2-oxohepta-3-ene-1,7-dioic acid hydratase in catechol pathway
MKIARFSTDGSDPRYGILDGDELVVLTGDPLYLGFETTDDRIPLTDATLLAPVIPRSKVIGILPGATDEDEEAEPIAYLKPNTTVTGPDSPVKVPDGVGTIEAFGALAIVIGSIAKSVRPGDAAQVVFGYTVANDITATDLAKADGQWTRAKGYDTFAPLGPYIETDIDADTVEIIVDVDGDEKRRGTIAQQVGAAVEFASDIFTLLPGDVILLPLVEGVEVDEGDTVEVTIAAIGTLRSDIRSR